MRNVQTGWLSGVWADAAGFIDVETIYLFENSHITVRENDFLAVSLPTTPALICVVFSSLTLQKGKGEYQCAPCHHVDITITRGPAPDRLQHVRTCGRRFRTKFSNDEFVATARRC